LFLMWQATNYFGAAIQRNMFAHTWSLGVEEQFYVLYPFLFRWRKPLLSKTLWDDRYRLGALLVLSAITLVLFIVAYRVNQPAAYFLMPCRFWELGLGCMVGLVSKGSENNGIARIFRIPSAIPLLAIIPGLVLGILYPVASTILVAVATTVLIGSVRHGSAIYKVLSSRPLTYLGSISYSLYLWHWVVICVSLWTIGIDPWSLPFRLVLMLLLAMASYHLVEDPLRRASWSGLRWGVIAIGIPTMIVVAGLILLSQRYKIPHFLGNDTVEASAANSPVPGYVAKYSHREINNCFAERAFDVKNNNFGNKVESCSAGADKGLRLIFLGDSHAMDLFPFADKIAADGVASVTNVFQPGWTVPPLKTDPAICAFENALVKKFASNGKENNILVIRVNYAPRYINGDLNAFSKDLTAFLVRTSAAGLKVIYILPSPKYYSVDDLCTPQWFRPEWAMGPECRNGFTEDRGEELARRRDVTDYLNDFSKTRNDFFVFDPFDTFCGSLKGPCTPLRNEQLIYRDSSHITERGSELLVAPFEAFLRGHHLTQDSAEPVNTSSVH
jgi:hypothetical protein